MLPVEWGSYEILSELAPHASSYLCIGVQEGVCLRHVLTANPSIRQLILCDTWGTAHGGSGRGNHDHISAMLRLDIRYRGDVLYLDGDSADLIPKLLPPDSVDLSYVDGDHAEEAALTDMVNVWPLTKKAMIVHDIRMPEVWAALTRFLDTVLSQCTVSIANGGTGTAVIWRRQD